MVLITGEEARARGLNPDSMVSVGGKFEVGDSSGSFGSVLDERLASVKQYVDELEGEARGNFDFVTKFLAKQHDMALGTDDAERAKFFESVANELEQRVGRIPFDFQQRTDREKQDLSDFLNQQRISQEDITSQQSEFEERQKIGTERDIAGVRESSNVRGFLGSGIEKAQQAETAETRRLSAEPQQRELALRKILNQLATSRGELESGRRLADITTGARRGAEDLQFSQEERGEEAQRTLDSRLAEARRAGTTEEARIRALSQQEEELRLFNA